MTTTQYTYLLAQPQSCNKEDFQALSQVVEAYPFFQSARALQLKHLKDTESYQYNDALKITAAYTTDRNILFEYITSRHFIQNQISEKILGHSEQILQLDVIAEDVSEQVSLEIDQQLKTELKKAEAILHPGLFQPKEETVSVEKPTEEETVLAINKPLSFSKEDTHSFTEWLKLASAKPVTREEENPPELDERESKFDLIERFIQQNPKLSLPEKSTSPPKNINLAAPYTQAPTSLMTETLAKVYLQQKNYSKAIQAYKILILKNPEKSGFFADQIRAIEKLKNKKNS